MMRDESFACGYQTMAIVQMKVFCLFFFFFGHGNEIMTGDEYFSNGYQIMIGDESLGKQYLKT